MPSGLSSLCTPRLVLASLAWLPLVQSSILGDLHNNYFAPAPAPEDGPAFSAHALRNKKYLPIQIGAIVAAYAVALVAVAVLLLSLAKTRRGHLLAADEDEAEAYAVAFQQLCSPRFPREDAFPQAGNFADEQVPNFSYKSPTRSEFYKSPTRSEFSATQYIHPPVSPAHTNVPGVEPLVDQAVVAADREMAQNQLEDMYKHVMEHEEAKEKGIVLESPVVGPPSQRGSGMSKKSKPTSLNLSSTTEDKTKSRASSFFSGLRSPRKSKTKGLNISSPIMTPQSTTFPRFNDQEMNHIPPRHYAPAGPPPIPEIGPVGQARTTNGLTLPPSPDMSPESTQSIDGRLGAQLAPLSTSKNMSQAPTEADPESAISEHSQAPLLGLPSSPKPGATFGTLPSSPRPGARFQRPNAPSAVRTGGALPLRAYEPTVTSPTTIERTTKQTVFERRGPLSPGGGRTPFTAGAVPYSPYQPYTPCVPITPSLVTKEDRKRMKKMVPKTPTVEMVQSSDDMW